MDLEQFNKYLGDGVYALMRYAETIAATICEA